MMPTFFKIDFLVIVIGVIDRLVFLPVLLSIFVKWKKWNNSMKSDVFNRCIKLYILCIYSKTSISGTFRLRRCSDYGGVPISEVGQCTLHNRKAQCFHLEVLGTTLGITILAIYIRKNKIDQNQSFFSSPFQYFSRIFLFYLIAMPIIWALWCLLKFSSESVCSSCLFDWSQIDK